jgi:hypothetical protein
MSMQAPFPCHCGCISAFWGQASTGSQGAANSLKIAYMGIVLISKGIFFFDAIAYLAGNSFIIASILERNAYKVMKINEKSKRAVRRLKGWGVVNAGDKTISFLAAGLKGPKIGTRPANPDETDKNTPAGEETVLFDVYDDGDGLVFGGKFIEALIEGMQIIKKERETSQGRTDTA